MGFTNVGENSLENDSPSRGRKQIPKLCNLSLRNLGLENDSPSRGRKRYVRSLILREKS